MGTTDIDRLHNVLLGNMRSSQRIGRTYAACISCANIVMLGNMDTIVWILPTMDRIDYILPMMSKVFTEYGLEFNSVRSNEVVSGNSRIIFGCKGINDSDFVGYDRERSCVVEEPI